MVKFIYKLIGALGGGYIGYKLIVKPLLTGSSAIDEIKNLATIPSEGAEMVKEAYNGVINYAANAGAPISYNTSQFVKQASEIINNNTSTAEKVIKQTQSESKKAEANLKKTINKYIKF
jgi:hypothetical protein